MLIRAFLAALLLSTAGVGAAETREIADCLVKHDSADAARFAASQPGSPEEAATVGALDGCDAAGALADPAQRMLIAGAIAERLSARVNRNLYGQRFVALDPDHLDAAGYSDQALRRFAAMPPRDAVVACAASRDPNTALAVLRAKPASGKEAKALQRLAPAIERCVAQGQRIALDRAPLRAMIARAVFSEGFTRNGD